MHFVLLCLGAPLWRIHIGRAACFALLLAVVGAAMFPSFAQAGQGSEHIVTAHGLQMVVDTRWVDGGGYRPVRIEFRPLKPLTSAMEITVQFTPQSGYGYGNLDQVSVTQDMEIPAGSSPAGMTMSVPQMGLWNTYALRVLGDGDDLPGLALSIGTGGNDYNRGQLTSSMLVLTNTPDVPIYDASRTVFFPTSNSQHQQLSMRTVTLLPQKFPERWLDYTSLDVVALSRQQIAVLAEREPKRFDALLDWVSSGGNLFITDVGQKFERLPDMERLLRLGLPADSPDDPVKRGWQEPREPRTDVPENTGPSYPGGPIINNQKAANYGPGSITQEGAILVSPQPGPPPENRPKGPRTFVWRRLAMGTVVAMGGMEFLQQDGDRYWHTGNTPVQQDARLVDSVDLDRLHWPERHGAMPEGNSQDFWDFLIPGVGLPPVGAFQILITLFVLGIGPLNYYLLQRYRRLHLLIVTIPLFALLVTGGLFLYALISDGLGVRARVRSYTQIDQRQKHAVTWARASYYAGLPPSDGMRFAADTAVYTISSNFDTSDGRRMHELAWGNDQHLSSGWISARTPAQFLTIRSRACKQGLSIAMADDGSTPSQVENRLGTRIEHLIVRGNDQQYYQLEGLEPGESAALTPATEVAALAVLRTLYHEHLPQAPPELMGSSPNYYRRSRWYYQMAYQDMAVPTQGNNVLESMLKEIAAPDGVPPAPGTYVAIVSQNPEVELGIAGAREEASFHIIVGNW